MEWVSNNDSIFLKYTCNTLLNIYDIDVSSCRSYDTLELNTNILQEEARLAQPNVDQTEVKRYVTTGNVYETLNVKNSIGDMGTYQHLLLDIPMTEIGSIITKKQKENAEGFKRDYAVCIFNKMSL